MKHLKDRQKQKLIAKLTRDIGKWKPCILCESGTQSRGYFLPEEPEKYGAQPEKSRVICYPICRNHTQTPEILSRIEKLILQEIWNVKA